MKEEKWIDIPGCEGRYLVSETGRVKRVERTIIDSLGRKRTLKEKIFEPRKANNGYMRTSVGMKAEYTHRLVAKAFIKNKDNKPCVNHKDGNKRNNHYSNLEWVTNKENMVHASKNNLINRDSNIRKKQAPINARKGKIKVYKKLCKYTLEGELVEVLENSLQGEPFRFSWKGYMYRSYEIFYKTYGFIPQKIAPLPKHFRYSAKK